MPDASPVWTGLLAGAALLWLFSSALATLLSALFVRYARRRRIPLPQPACVVLSPVKGASAVLPLFASRLLDQDHADYRVLFLVESEADPAFAVLSPLAEAAAGRAEVLVAGPATDRGQKVHNLITGLRALRPEDRVVAFVDADFEPQRDWLSQLCRPLSKRHRMTSGYTVLVPRLRTAPNILAGIVSLAISTSFAPKQRGLCWGGATAIERDTLDRLDPEKVFADTVSDDLSLSRAAWRARIGVYMNMAIRVATPINYDWASLKAYSRRQYRLIRIYTPGYWILTLLTLVIPPAGFFAALALIYAESAWWALVPLLVIALHQGRCMLRRRALGAILDAETMAELAPTLRLQHLITPLAWAAHAWCFAGSAFGRDVTWAGRTYRIDSPERMRILSGPPHTGS